MRFAYNNARAECGMCMDATTYVGGSLRGAVGLEGTPKEEDAIREERRGDISLQL
jgi:hypothetical protein